MKFKLSTPSRILRGSCFLLLASLIFSIPARTDNTEPKDATGWFKRASDQMSLRVYDAAPFHMKVVFKALPGLELLEGKKKPQIITGDGVYEETWLAPHHWRREVTLGYYHAVEVESEQGRKMQSSSSDRDDTPSRRPRDYEPSRVLMLLKALLYPVRAEHISPDLARGHAYRDWVVEHKTTGNLAYVLVRADLSRFPVDVDIKSLPQTAYIFLPGGTLVQSIDGGLTTSWQDDVNFAGHVVPRRLTIQSGDRTLVTADITVQTPGPVDPAAFELPGETADPGMTLRPLRSFEVTPPGIDERCGFGVDLDIPILPLVIGEVIDRHGATQEEELLDARNLDVKGRSGGVAGLLDCRRKIKVHPATIDKSPAELELTVIPQLKSSHK